MSDTPIRVETLGAVRRLSLARPAARNAQNMALLDALDAALCAAADDDAVHVVVLAAEGDHFSAGHDLKEAAEKRGAIAVEARYRYEEKRYFEYCLRLRDFPKPTIAQVQGACVAGGFMLANMCDLIVASEDAYFSDPVGHTMGAAATEVLIHPWVLGLRQAKELLFTGGRLGAAQALALGMLNQVVPRTELEAKTMELAERIGRSPPFAMKLIKRSLNRAQDGQGLREALSSHFDLHQLSHVSEEYQATVRAGLAGAIRKNQGGA